MLRLEALHQRDSLAENGHVTLHYAIHIILHGKGGAALAAALEVWIDGTGAYHSAVYGQSFILVTVLRMFHCGVLF